MTKSRIIIASILKIFRPAVVLLILLPVLASCAGREFAADPVSTAETEAESASVSDADNGQAVGGGTETASLSEDEAWFLVTEVQGDRDYNVYVDTSTIDTIEGEVMSWSKLVFDADQEDSDGLVYREVMIASSINCGQKTYMYMSSKFYDSLGKMVYMENIATNRNPIPGGTVSEIIANFVCGYEPPKGKGNTRQ